MATDYLRYVVVGVVVVVAVVEPTSYNLIWHYIQYV
jgi:hypothetical protein